MEFRRVLFRSRWQFEGCEFTARRRGSAESNATEGPVAEWDEKRGEKCVGLDGCFLTRRRGDADEGAERQQESQNLRARSQRRSRGQAARRARQWTTGQRREVAGRFPQSPMPRQGPWRNGMGDLAAVTASVVERVTLTRRHKNLINWPPMNTNEHG